MTRKVLTLVLFMFVSSSLWAQSEVDGTWDFSMDSPTGSASATVIMKSEGSTLTGEFDLGGGRKWPIEEGTIDGGNIAFSITRDGASMTYEMSGSIEGDSIKGVADVPPILSSTSVESPIIRKGRSDVKKRFTEAQIIGFLREAEAGLPVKDLCRRHGFSEASYYLWRSKFGGMTVSDAKRLKELETENGRLKKLLAESQLEIEVTREVLQKKW